MLCMKKVAAIVFFAFVYMQDASASTVLCKDPKTYSFDGYWESFATDGPMAYQLSIDSVSRTGFFAGATIDGKFWYGKLSEFTVEMGLLTATFVSAKGKHTELLIGAHFNPCGDGNILFVVQASDRHIDHVDFEQLTFLRGSGSVKEAMNLSERQLRDAVARQDP